MNNEDKFSDIKMKLSNEELKKIASLNKLSNAVNKRIKNDDHIMNMSIKNVIKLWAKNNIDILVDITKFLSNFKKYNQYFDDIDETKLWFDGIKIIITDLFVIFTKEKRIIFVGITLLLLSFGLYIIQITS
tara:strand:- start:463 stop:855 length:393 start_codon:yes stop_codon:yes gene_type:complete